MKHILFVCTGNTCRSSIAEGFLKDAVEKDEYLSGKVSVASVGIAALDGDMASENSIKVLKDNWGIDISSHRARRITELELKKADLVLTMTVSHKMHIISMFPSMRNKIFTLKEYAYETFSNSRPGYGCDVDIIDPYGAGLNFYRKCGEEIKKAVEKLLLKLKNSI